MACHCNDCSSSKRIGTLRQLQVEKCVKSKGKVYPARSEKIWRDRIDEARKALIKAQADLAEELERHKTCIAMRYATCYHGGGQQSVDWRLRRLKQYEAEAIRVLGKLPAAK